MISKEEVQQIAKLARIELSDQEIEKFRVDLASILEYFDILKEVHVSEVEPMTHSIEVNNVLRRDNPKREKPELVRKLMEMTPDKKDGFLKVKSIFSYGGL